ncbi:hypothetical protein ACFVU2_10495 [Leifsonia sp. NPDC058194]|uniref:hypothetical protein n=1 Tax=Leifsonia sp. NPDC058194 TaxID=3346374 RepID=UPI0036DF8C9A
MAERSIAQKLLLRAGDILAVDARAPGLAALLGAIPDGVSEGPAAEASVAVLFVESREELLDRFGSELPALAGARAVWFVYPKGNRADLNRDTIIRESGAFGWRPISNVSVDEVWSAVRVRPLTGDETPVG